MKKCLAAAAWLAILPCAASPQSTDAIFATGTVGGIIDGWHAAAAAADEQKYFSYFTPDAVFLGTDSTERWTRDEFRKFAHPYFAKGKAWNFKTVSRWISFAPDRTVAWFDEMLDTPNLGPCRGSGVVVFTNAGWKIAQYNLSIPIPNDLVDDFKKQIEEYAKQPKQPKKGP